MHDAVTFDENTRTGGPNGSIRVGRELARAENVGLEGAMAALEGVKAKFEAVSYADLIQLAGAVAVEMVGGPLVEMNVGRKDSKACPPSGRVPTAAKGSAAVKAAFERAGLSNVDAAAVLCAVPVGSSTERPTGALALTPLDLGSSYLSKVTSGPAEEAVTELLQQDDDMRVTVLKWQENEDDFLEAFGEAFKKLSEVGCKGLVRPRKGAPGAVAQGQRLPVTLTSPVLAPQALTVNVPAAAAPGQVIQVAMPGGGMTAVTLPADAVPGQSFKFTFECVQLDGVSKKAAFAVVTKFAVRAASS